MNQLHLKVFTDGGARGNPGPAAIGVVIFDSSNHTIHEFSEYIGNTTNNIAEYTAVLKALQWIIANLEPIQLDFYLDSSLVVNQLNGKFKIKQNHLKKLSTQIHLLISKHQLHITFTHIYRHQNSRADHLLNQTLNSLS